MEQNLPNPVVDTILNYLDRSSRTQLARAIPRWHHSVEDFKRRLFKYQWVVREFPRTKVVPKLAITLPASFPVGGIVDHWTHGKTAYVLFYNSGLVVSWGNERVCYGRFDVLGDVSMRFLQREFIKSLSWVSEAGLMIETPFDASGAHRGSIVLATVFLARTSSNMVDLVLEDKYTLFGYHVQRLSGFKHQLLMYDFILSKLMYFETDVRGCNNTKKDKINVREKWKKSIMSRLRQTANKGSQAFCLNDSIAVFPSSDQQGGMQAMVLNLANGETIREISLATTTPVALSLKESNILVVVQDSATQLHYRCSRFSQAVGNIYLYDLKTGNILASKVSKGVKFGLHSEDAKHPNKLVVFYDREGGEPGERAEHLQDGCFLEDLNEVITRQLDCTFRAIAVAEHAHSLTWMSDDVLLMKHDSMRNGRPVKWVSFNGWRGDDAREDEGYMTKSVRGREPRRIVSDGGVVALSKDVFVRLSGANRLERMVMTEGRPLYFDNRRFRKNPLVISDQM